MVLRRIEIVEDRTAGSRCDQGFLRVARLRLRNVYDDDSTSDVYDCDIVSRRNPDAVVAVLYDVHGDGRVTVFLREAPRAPIYLRRFKKLEQPDAREYDRLLEVVAGMLESGDGAGEAGLCGRAAAEAREEAGLVCSPESFA